MVRPPTAPPKARFLKIITPPVSVTDTENRRKVPMAGQDEALTPASGPRMHRDTLIAGPDLHRPLALSHLLRKIMIPPRYANDPPMDTPPPQSQPRRPAKPGGHPKSAGFEMTYFANPANKQGARRPPESPPKTGPQRPATAPANRSP